MGDSRKVLEEIVGVEGYETLAKAIFRRGTQNVADPLELYLPLLVVPRTILSWLAHNIAPMPSGSLKELKFPGRPDILINIQKFGSDVYRGDMVQGGRVIHAFENQTLPSIGGHIMTVMEQYDHLKDDEKPKDKAQEVGEKYAAAMDEAAEGIEEQERQRDERMNLASEVASRLHEKLDGGTGLVQHIMNANGIKAPDAEEAKWAYAHGNVKELVGVIGKLVDALVSRNIQKDGPKETEVKVDLGVRDSEVPAIPAEHKHPEIKHKIISDAQVERMQDRKIDCKEVPQGKEHREAEPKLAKESMDKEGASPAGPGGVPAGVPGDAGLDQGDVSNAVARVSLNFGYVREKCRRRNEKGKCTDKKAELLEKPYASDAQRRWAHTDKGTKALGGAKAVEHWDKESKGKDLPEHVSKDENIPSKRPQMSSNAWFRMSYKQKKAHVASKFGPKPDPKAAMDAAVRAVEQAASKQKKDEMGITHPKVSAVPTGPGSMVTTKPHKPDAGTIATLKSGSSCEPNTANTIPDNLDRNANAPKTSLDGIVNKDELGKGGPEAPSGAAMPKGPQAPQAPKAPVPPGHQPAAAAQKQAQASARGAQAKPPGAGAKPPAPSKTPAKPKVASPMAPKGPALKSEDYFRSRKPVAKAEKSFHVTEQEIMEPCEHCGTPEFTMKGDNPVYTPCACFRITLSERRFVSLEKKESGYSIKFAKNSDPETVKAFLLTLKAKLLLAKKGVA